MTLRALSTLQVVNATSSSAAEPHERPTGSDGRRASRWGKPEAVGALVSSNISTSVNADTGGGGEGTDPEVRLEAHQSCSNLAGMLLLGKFVFLPPIYEWLTDANFSRWPCESFRIFSGLVP